MPSISFSVINRRGFLRLGVVAGMLGAAGCDDGGGGPTTITTPAPANGNRSRLKALQEKTEESKSKQQKK
jgi:hypothetical protein